VVDSRYKLKVVMLGDFAVGKTSLINRYVNNIFDERYLTTLGARISKKDVRVESGSGARNVSLILWDLSGNDGLHSVLPQYLKGAAGAIVVADVTRPETFRSVARHIGLFEGHNPGGSVVAGCNKMDLIEASRRDALRHAFGQSSVVPPDRLFYTSAKDATEVEAMFLALARILVDGPRDV
jgi:small GTP-binding protein